MSTYRKKPKVKPIRKPNVRTATKTEIGILRTLNKLKIKPLTKFQIALMDEGPDTKPSLLSRLYHKYPAVFSLFEKVFVVAIILCAIFINPYYLLILPAMGAMLFYRNRFRFLWWKIKINVLFRDYYEDRRILFNQGTLFHHLSVKLPKRYMQAVIWGQSKNVQEIKFRKLQKSNSLKKREYIL